MIEYQKNEKERNQMKNILKNNKGVTLAVLVITIIILLIIAGVTITVGFTSTDKYIDSELESEIRMVQTAVISQYDKYLIVKDTELLVGDKCDQNGNLNEAGEYNLLESEDLIKIGMKNPKDTFIVNYRTGEVINKTTTFSDGTKIELDGNLD